MKKTILALLIIFTAIISANAQKINIKSGSLAPLKGEKAINIQFKYDNMWVGKMSEEDYLAKRIKELNDKEPGRGTSWSKAWVNDRTRLFEPKFIELFNKPNKLVITEKPQKYTMIFHTTFTEPGFNVGVVRSNAKIDATVTIVETENPEKVIAVILITDAPGRTATGYDFATGERLSESYAVSGKKLVNFIEKNSK